MAGMDSLAEWAVEGQGRGGAREARRGICPGRRRPVAHISWVPVKQDKGFSEASCLTILVLTAFKTLTFNKVASFQNLET